MNQEHILLSEISVAAQKFPWEMHDFCPSFMVMNLVMCHVVKRGRKKRGEMVWCLETKPIRLTVRGKKITVSFALFVLRLWL